MIIKKFKIVCVDLSRWRTLHSTCVPCYGSTFLVIIVRSIHAKSHKKKINVNKYLVKFCAYKSINLDPQGS